LRQHFVRFDPQASDGVITGLSFEQSVRHTSAGKPGETKQTEAASSGAAKTTVASSTRRLSHYVNRELGTNLILNMGNESS
jgi:hypothetical protein